MPTGERLIGRYSPWTRNRGPMLRIITEVDAPPGQAIGVKEALAMEAERYGDTRVISVVEVLPEQMKLQD